MLLKIIDNYKEKSESFSTENNSIIMLLSGDGFSEEYVCEYYGSPFSVNFREEIQNFLFDRILYDSVEKEKASPMEKLVRLGHALGDSLLGEDHELLRFLSIIEKEGYEKLDVSIISDRPEFLSELWETMILHDSKYLFSTQVKRFSRVFSRYHKHSLPILEYQLNVTPPHQNEINQLLNKDDDTYSVKENNPLRVLYAFHVSKYDPSYTSVSNNIQACLSFNELNSALDVEICCLKKVSDLSIVISSKTVDYKTYQYHVLHLYGKVSFEDKKVKISSDNLRSGEFIDLEELLCCSLRHGICVLFLDITEYRDEGLLLEHSVGLARVAYIAHRIGIANIVGLSYKTLPWLSEACFLEIYRQILAGHDLSIAMVEARKVMQAQHKNRYCLDEFNHFPLWLLPLHYSSQYVQFFSAPQISQDGTEISPLNSAHVNMFGFRGEKLPHLTCAVSDQYLSHIIAHVQSNTVNSQAAPIKASAEAKVDENDYRSGKVIIITGSQGIGKTHHAYFSCFYLSLKQQYRYSFNFSFADEDYRTEDIHDMIAPVLQSKAADVIEKLKTVPCTFIFDDIDVLMKSQDDQRIQDFTNLFIELKQQHHCVFLVGNFTQHKSVVRDYFESGGQSLSDLYIELRGLEHLPSRIVGSLTLEKGNFSLGEKNADSTSSNTRVIPHVAWKKMIIHSMGNAGVIQRLTPLLLQYDIEDIFYSVNEDNINSHNPLDVINHWQWMDLPLVLQNFLRIGSEIPGLLLEMIMIASDQQQETYSPSKKLFSLLGDKNIKVKEGIQQLSSAGFTKLLPHGHMVDNKALYFLKTYINKSVLDIENGDEISILFSQVITQGVLLLSQFVLKNPNPSMSNNLISNRRHWVKNFERLWFYGDYSRFMLVKKAFQKLLTQENIQHELIEWSADLLERSDITTEKIENNGFAIAWLGLAIEAISLSHKAKDNKGIDKGAEIWFDWFVQHAQSIREKDLTHFQMVVSFLDNHAKLNSNIDRSNDICRQSYSVYSKFEAWYGVIGMLKSLTINAFARHNTEEGENYERKILEEIPYDDSPPGFHVQQMLDVLLMRMSRQAFDKAKTLFNEIKEREDSAPMIEILDGVEADLRFQKGHYVDSLPYFCKLWERTINIQSLDKIEQLQSRFRVFEDKIGREKLELLLSEYLDDSSPSPLDKEFSIH